ncbi:hypothetical protein [Streptomyces sp. NPDC053431]|uniref:hypothetical protein n=1 Tax=Streptomyces sp. NPDC053431 TaxID=3365703 RepID=UPI0037CFEB6F
MNHDDTPSRLRLERALDRLGFAFRGMTARSDEIQCACHWGSEEELARLKVPDVVLAPGLLGRAWATPDWNDHGAVLRRILPQFARALVGGLVEPVSGMAEVGRSFARGHWRQWPARQGAAVWEFLRAWWAHTLAEPDPAVPAYEVLALCAEASGALGPWLAAWEAADHPAADQWDAWDDEDALRAELTAWLLRHAAVRLAAYGAPEELLHRIRLIGLTGPARWEDPHWPDHRY